MAHGIPARLTPAEGRKFAFTVGGAFAVLAAITWWRDHPTFSSVFAALAGGLLLAGLLVPGSLGPVSRGWMSLAHLISRVTTPVFMGIVFFGVIMPAGLLMRLLGRNPIRHQAVNQSYWADRSDGHGGMNNQF